MQAGVAPRKMFFNIAIKRAPAASEFAGDVGFGDILGKHAGDLQTVFFKQVMAAAERAAKMPAFVF